MTQTDALTILKMGTNVFLTGEPGAGKTYTLNRYIDYLKHHQIPVAVTASTGIAATHIGGTTIHSWSGVGIKRNLSARHIDDLCDREYLYKRINKAEVLIIDEISMLDAIMLTDIDRVCQAMRRSPEPFGGLQVVLVGDFFQLPPISRTSDPSALAYESPSWKQARLAICYLDEQHRQSDSELADLLHEIRSGSVSSDWFPKLEATQAHDFADGIEPVRLFTHNQNVDVLNQARLDELEARATIFSMTSRGRDNHVEKLRQSCLSPEQLELKVGAVVMCTKNNFDAGYVNGTMGIVIDFDDVVGYPIIETTTGKRHTIEPAKWAFEDDGKSIAEVSQVPLRLAWAITVHKSQGMSIDRAEIDLSATFEFGQGYVALSRLRSLSGLRLLGYNQQALQVNPTVQAMDGRFRKLSDAAVERIEDLSADEVKQRQREAIMARGGVLEPKKSNQSDTKRKTKVQSHEKTFNYLLEEWNLDDIATERQVKTSTIIGHVGRLLEEKRLSPDQLEYLTQSDDQFAERVQAVTEAIASNTDGRLTTIKKALGDEYSFDDIAWYRLFSE